MRLCYWHRAQQWLFPQLYLTGRQTERRNLMKEPPSPIGSSSSEADGSAPRRYVRCATWTPLCTDHGNSMLQTLAWSEGGDRPWGLAVLPIHGLKGQCQRRTSVRSYWYMCQGATSCRRTLPPYHFGALHWACAHIAAFAGAIAGGVGAWAYAVHGKSARHPRGVHDWTASTQPRSAALADVCTLPFCKACLIDAVMSSESVTVLWCGRVYSVRERSFDILYMLGADWGNAGAGLRAGLHASGRPCHCPSAYHTVSSAPCMQGMCKVAGMPMGRPLMCSCLTLCPRCPDYDAHGHNCK